jgi:hypothetical protein
VRAPEPLQHRGWGRPCCSSAAVTGDSCGSTLSGSTLSGSSLRGATGSAGSALSGLTGYVSGSSRGSGVSGGAGGSSSGTRSMSRASSWSALNLALRSSSTWRSKYLTRSRSSSTSSSVRSVGSVVGSAPESSCPSGSVFLSTSRVPGPFIGDSPGVHRVEVGSGWVRCPTFRGSHVPQPFPGRRALAVALMSCYKPRTRGRVAFRGFLGSRRRCYKRTYADRRGWLRTWGKLAASVPAGL